MTFHILFVFNFVSLVSVSYLFFPFVFLSPSVQPPRTYNFYFSYFDRYCLSHVFSYMLPSIQQNVLEIEFSANYLVLVHPDSNARLESLKFHNLKIAFWNSIIIIVRSTLKHIISIVFCFLVIN